MFLQQLFEAINQQHAAFCFGRMNPPTEGHQQLINTVVQEGRGGDFFIFTSQTQDAKKNPLDYQTKVRFLRALYPGIASHIVYDTNLKTIMQVAAWLYNKGYRKVTFVAGSDRLPDFQELLNKYNGVEGGAVYYKFDSINFVSSGERDPDSEGVEGISASAAREAAKAGNYEAFSQAVGAGKLTQELYDAVRKGMNITESDMEDFVAKLKKDYKEKDKDTQRIIQGNDVTGSQKPDSTYDPYSPTPRVSKVDEDYDAKLEKRLSKAVPNYNKSLDDAKRHAKLAHAAQATASKDSTPAPKQRNVYDVLKNFLSKDLNEGTFTDSEVRYMPGQGRGKSASSYTWKHDDKYGWHVRDPKGVVVYKSSETNSFKAKEEVKAKAAELNNSLTESGTREEKLKQAIEIATKFANQRYSDVRGLKVTGIGELDNPNYFRAEIRWPAPGSKTFRETRYHNLSWQTGQEVKTDVSEDASGYIPKNKKEAKDPRWSNALSVDVNPDTPAKNMKALRLI